MSLCLCDQRKPGCVWKIIILAILFAALSGAKIVYFTFTVHWKTEMMSSLTLFLLKPILLFVSYVEHKRRYFEECSRCSFSYSEKRQFQVFYDASCQVCHQWCQMSSEAQMRFKRRRKRRREYSASYILTFCLTLFFFLREVIQVWNDMRVSLITVFICELFRWTTALNLH